MKIATVLLMAAVSFPICVPAGAQQFRLPPDLEKLASQAEETVDVTLDGDLLQLAGKFLSDSDSDQVKVKKMLSGLQGIYVRSYEFGHEGGYSPADLQMVRAQFPRPDWSTIVGVRSRETGENVDVFLKAGSDGSLGGIAVIAAEPKAFTIVNIVGRISPEQLADLGGHFGIGHFDATGWSSGRRRP